MNTDDCSECICSTPGIITSPGYPDGYSSNMSVSWVIHAPPGQRIGIHFISFDLQDRMPFIPPNFGQCL